MPGWWFPLLRLFLFNHGTDRGAELIIALETCSVGVLMSTKRQLMVKTLILVLRGRTLLDLYLGARREVGRLGSLSPKRSF